MVPPTKRSGNRAYFLGLLLLLLAFVIYFLQDSSNSAKNKTTEALKKQEAQELVNRHLQESSREKVLREQAAAIEMQRRLIEMQKSKPQRPYNYNPQQLEIQEYQESHSFNENVGRGHKNFSFPQDPNQLIQKELFEDNKEQRYSEAYKQEYTRQFIENAKHAGWDIKVDSSFRVISVKPLRQRSPSYEVFGGETHSGR